MYCFTVAPGSSEGSAGGLLIKFVLSLKAVVPNLGPPDVLGLQLPEAFTTTPAGASHPSGEDCGQEA